MAQIPHSLRKHIGLVGKTNAGKSSLFNALLGQDAAIVSEQRGTTTDPVVKAMELIPFGPVVLVDTPGLSDDTGLGDLRTQAAVNAMRRCDLLLLVMEAREFQPVQYEELQKLLPSPHLLVLSKSDRLDESRLSMLVQAHPGSVAVSSNVSDSVDALKARLIEELEKLEESDVSLVGDLVPPGGSAVLVVPIDTEAPKGRLILPQVQLIRDCLDHGVLCHVCREHELLSMLEQVKRADLVVTDSQAFAYVESVIPEDLPLTSFSMLLARQKGDIRQLVRGARKLEDLPEQPRILMLESCTHNHTHEDIGRVKIPALIRKKTGKNPEFQYSVGYDFPPDYSQYDLVIQCGGCMVNKREITARLRLLEKAGVPVTNYGVALAHLSGILGRCAKVFSL